ncbi:MAG: hypothetical protein M1819_000145 [Sarea resinae]|nr:MAG: hypothetical protein M1819_000145 [Sarea resinae]
MTFNSGDEDDVDFQSDTVFDSLRTVTTGASSSGPRGPRIDTIFDESPPQLPTKGSLIDLQDLLRDGLFPDHAITAVDKSACIEEDNGSLSTPVQSSKCSEDDLSTPIRAKVPGPTIDGLSTFQGKFLKSNLDSPYFDGDAEAEGFDGWSFDRDYDSPIKSPIKYSGSSDARNSLSLPQSPHANLSGMNHESPNDSSQTLSIEHTDKDARSSLFDWSEQQPIRKDSPTGSSARPNTVHGKQGTDVRGSRASGRRGPSAAHVRSQSVPVVPESGNKRDPSGGANRFGTWGNSSKVPTEDWDDDFEFDDSNALEKKGGKDGDDTRVDSGVAMIVPKAIQEQQANVLGHLGHVREFALLVEDLKRLRIRATAKGILNGPSESLWTEAEGIINLATLDDDEQELSPPHSPSSADFNFDPFEDDATPAQPVRFQRKSVLSPDDDIFGEGKAKSHYYANPASKLDKTQASPSGRNRKDSTAMAKSVLANMYQRRDGSNQLMSANKSQPQHKRMYFDTTTLRDLVAHVNVLARNLSEIVRSVDSVPSSPDFGPNRPDTPFPDLFVDIPLDSSNGKENSPNSKDGTGTIIALQGNGRGLHGRMDRMVVL